MPCGSDVNPLATASAAYHPPALPAYDELLFRFGLRLAPFRELLALLGVHALWRRLPSVRLLQPTFLNWVLADAWIDCVVSGVTIGLGGITIGSGAGLAGPASEPAFICGGA